jgi:hypothetical protein
VADIDEFIARPIALDLVHRDVITEWDFEPCFGPEHELAEARMQPVGADDRIDFARGGMIEADPHAVTPILDPHNGVAKVSVQCSVDRSREDGRRGVISSSLQDALAGMSIQPIALSARGASKRGPSRR